MQKCVLRLVFRKEIRDRNDFIAHFPGICYY